MMTSVSLNADKANIPKYEGPVKPASKWLKERGEYGMMWPDPRERVGSREKKTQREKDGNR